MALPRAAPSLASPEDVEEADENSQGQEGVAGSDAAGAADVAEEGVAAVNGGGRDSQVDPGAGADGGASLRDGLAGFAAWIWGRGGEEGKRDRFGTGFLGGFWSPALQRNCSTDRAGVAQGG